MGTFGFKMVQLYKWYNLYFIIFLLYTCESNYCSARCRGNNNRPGPGVRWAFPGWRGLTLR